MEHTVPAGYTVPPTQSETNGSSPACAIAGDDKHLRFDAYCVDAFEQVPTRKWAAKAIKRFQILLNNAPADSSRYVQAGDIITFAHDNRIPPKLYEFKLTVLFEDEYLAVIVKPAGIPTNGSMWRTAENALPFNLKKSTISDALTVPRTVHRLDTPTSGLLLCAKTAAAHAALGKMFESKQVQKRYMALVVGRLEGEGDITVDVDGRRAHSKYKVLAHHRSIVPGWLTTVDLVPVTGRTHQLRRHMQHMGTPILGDSTYGDEGTTLKKHGLWLCSVELRFMHPFTHKEIALQHPMPAKFSSHRDREQRRWDEREHRLKVTHPQRKADLEKVLTELLVTVATDKGNAALPSVGVTQAPGPGWITDVDRSSCRSMLALLAMPDTDVFSHSTVAPGHFVASAYVLSPDRTSLLTVARGVSLCGALLQTTRSGVAVAQGDDEVKDADAAVNVPTVHIDPLDASPAAAAQRGVTEVLGTDLALTPLRPEDSEVLLLGLDSEEMTAAGCTHFHLRFAFVAQSSQLQVQRSKPKTAKRKYAQPCLYRCCQSHII
eukprot:m.495888 g.495888  ORF g.495888 m.495888 type:complete len:547 (+) comp21803_c0_seq4:367-2007(+)